MNRRTVVSFSAIIFLMLLTNIAVFASAPQYNSPMRGDAAYAERDRQFRELEQQRKKSANRKDELNQAMMSQLREDFLKLYELRQNQLLPTLTAISLEYQTITKATEEIKTRASRIRQNLLSMLSVRDEKKKKEYTIKENELPASCSELSTLINRFVNSPVFQVNSPNDNELKIAAREDLEGIIKLSDNINKVARKLMKSPNSNQQ